MSIWYAQDARCPGCGADLRFDLARGVHITRVPAVRATILDGSFHRPTCGACGLAFEATREVVYTDFDRHHWVHVAAPHTLRAWVAAERRALALFDGVFAAGPPAAAALAARFTVRAVFDYDELRERLVLWDAGLDDALVECAKVRAIAERIELGAHDRRLRVRTVDADGSLHVASVPIIAPRETLAHFHIPAAVLATIAADRATWQDRYPELFRPGFVSVDRLLRTDHSPPVEPS